MCADLMANKGSFFVFKIMWKKTSLISLLILRGGIFLGVGMKDYSS